MSSQPNTAPTRTTPAELRQRLAGLLVDDPQAGEVLERWDRWGTDLVRTCGTLYADPDLVTRLVDLIAAGHLARRERLRDLDWQRLQRPDWFQQSNTIGYQAYTERFGGDLRGVARRVDYLERLGVTYLHLMPLFDVRPGANDGGYAVMDYDRVRPDLGTMADLTALADRLHESGIAVALDLVLNHVAREHRWARAARAGDPHYQRYFWTFPDRELPDAYEKTVAEVFPLAAPGNFTWDDDLRQWVWTSFRTWQWDLNWSNPDVLVEFAEIVVALANRGVDALRLDAIPFLWKRMGTSCTNQPEVHDITAILRAVARMVAPSLIFKAEAIVGPDQVVDYLGTGEHAGRLSDMAYHNSLMAHIWSALATRDTRLMQVALSRMKPPPSTAAWATYVRCHDDIGWAIDDADAAAVGWDGRELRAFLSEFYSGERDESFAEGVDFQRHPVTGDRRVNGSAASLAGIGLCDPLAVDRLVLAYSMVFGFGGMPIIYMGDELALLNDHSYLDDPELADDTRWVHRPHMPWDRAETGNDVYDRVHRLVQVRKSCASLHAAVPTQVLATSNPAVVCFERRHPAGDLLQVYNVSDHPVRIPAADLDQRLSGPARDLISDHPIAAIDGHYELPPYASWWLTA